MKTWETFLGSWAPGCVVVGTQRYCERSKENIFERGGNQSNIFYSDFEVSASDEQHTAPNTERSGWVSINQHVYQILRRLHQLC